MDDEEKAEAEKKTEDFRKLQEELQAAKPKGTVRAGPPQIERSSININTIVNQLVSTVSTLHQGQAASSIAIIY